ncbi:RICIN domain-containing protein [Actinosynnema sp. NPDC059335]|uniref:RICIN domain-containing protein n=1 Tax=Actinosynnema sp. NPDC059335 TaxID=3346804 RepID=UPI0036723D35
MPPFDRSPSPLSGESPAVPPVPLVPPGESPAPPSPPPSGGLLAPLSGEPPTSPKPPWRRPAVVSVAVALVAFVVAAVLVRADQPNPPGTTALEQTGGSNAEPGDTGGPSAELLPVAPAGSWATIHAADAPDLCLTEGRDGSGRYHAAVAALQPCAAPGPRVLLEPVDDEFTTIKWEHPSEKVLGCLTVLRSGPARHLLEPWDNCADDNLDQLFRVERVRDQRYRFRSAGGSACVGLRGGVVREGAEAVREPCADERDQEFTVDLRTGGG